MPLSACFWRVDNPLEQAHPGLLWVHFHESINKALEGTSKCWSLNCGPTEKEGVHPVGTFRVFCPTCSWDRQLAVPLLLCPVSHFLWKGSSGSSRGVHANFHLHASNGLPKSELEKYGIWATGHRSELSTPTYPWTLWPVALCPYSSTYFWQGLQAFHFRPSTQVHGRSRVDAPHGGNRILGEIYVYIYLSLSLYIYIYR